MFFLEGKGPQNFGTWIIKLMAKFRGDRPTELGDLAVKTRKKERKEKKHQQ